VVAAAKATHVPRFGLPAISKLASLMKVDRAVQVAFKRSTTSPSVVMEVKIVFGIPFYFTEGRDEIRIF
jgi:hypothetical protein